MSSSTWSNCLRTFRCQRATDAALDQVGEVARQFAAEGIAAGPQPDRRLDHGGAQHERDLTHAA